MVLICQILNLHATKIDWDKLTLPNGRDVKSCRNMLDGEKRKVGLNRASTGSSVGPSPQKSAGSGAKANGGGKKGKAATKKGVAAQDGTDGDTGAEADCEGAAGKAAPAKKAASRKRKSSTAVAAAEDNKSTAGDDADYAPTPKRKRAPPKDPKGKKAAPAVNTDQHESDVDMGLPSPVTGPQGDPVSSPPAVKSEMSSQSGSEEAPAVGSTAILPMEEC